MPADVDARRRLIAPAADAIQRRLSPSGRAIYQAPGMLGWVPPAVQNKPSELPTSYRSTHLNHLIALMLSKLLCTCASTIIHDNCVVVQVHKAVAADDRGGSVMREVTQD